MTSDGRAGCTHDRRCHALILPATFASPRRGEATALRRCDLDLDAHVRVRPAYAERSTGGSAPRPAQLQDRPAYRRHPPTRSLRHHVSTCRSSSKTTTARGQPTVKPALRRSAHRHQISPLRAPEAATAAIKIVVQNDRSRVLAVTSDRDAALPSSRA